MIARGLAILAALKRERPEAATRIDRDRLARALEARRRVPTEADRIAARLRGLGYEVRYGFDSDLGDYAIVRIPNAPIDPELGDTGVVAMANRCGSVAACLRAVAGELGVRP